jgi:hypothetical protein
LENTDENSINQSKTNNSTGIEDWYGEEKSD